MRGDALNQVFAAAGRPRVGGEIADCPFQIGPGVQKDPENDFGPLTGGLLMPLLRLVSLQEGELYRGGPHLPLAGARAGDALRRRPREVWRRLVADRAHRSRASRGGRGGGRLIEQEEDMGHFGKPLPEGLGSCRLSQILCRPGKPGRRGAWSGRQPKGAVERP